MSGSLFASWARVRDPLNYAVQLAKYFNCSIPNDLTNDHNQVRYLMLLFLYLPQRGGHVSGEFAYNTPWRTLVAGDEQPYRPRGKSSCGWVWGGGVCISFSYAFFTIKKCTST